MSPRVDALLQDLRFSVRSLAKRPMLAVVTVATLGVAIGANAAIFSAVRAVLLKPLPFREPERLVWVWDASPQRDVPRRATSPVGWAAYRDETDVFEALGGSHDWLPNLTGTGEPESVIAYRFSGDFFQLLGATPLLGRTFGPEETRPGHDRVVVLSHSLWQRRFGGDPEVLGRAATLDGTPYTVIGVMPPAFAHPARVELWAPMVLDAEQASDARLRFVRMIGRLRPGVSREQAQTAVASVARRLAERYPDGHGGYTAVVNPIESRYTGDVKPALLVLLGAVGLVLLIACANVSNLLLVRAADRRREMAVRASLGAGRRRLIAQLLTESVVLAGLGGALGVGIAFWGVDLLLGLFPTSIANIAIPRVDQIRVDGTVLAFAAAVTLLTGILFGLFPAVQASRASLSSSLREGGRSVGEGRGSRRFRSTLVVAEFALAVVLTAGAALLIRSFLRLQGGDLGFDAGGVTTARMLLPDYKYDTPEKKRAFFTSVMERVRALPGVDSAGSVTFIPLSGWNAFRLAEVEGRPAPSREERPEVAVRWVDDSYFETMRIPVRQGQAISPQDGHGTPPVVLVNETLARRLFPGEDPVGRRIALTRHSAGPADPPEWLQIVGVVGDVRHRGLAEAADPEAFRPYLQEPVELVSLMVRTRPGLAIGGSLRQAVWSVDPDQPVLALLPLEQLAAESITLRRVSTVLLGVFAGIALFLATLGIYGVMAHSVARRTHEIGVRMAVGAATRDVLALVLKEGATLAGLGAAVGLLAAFGLTRLLESLLFGVTATDPLSFAAVVAVLAAAALLACFVPARRAAGVDPVVALRYE